MSKEFWKVIDAQMAMLGAMSPPDYTRVSKPAYEAYARVMWEQMRTLPPLTLDRAVATIQGRPWPGGC